MAAGRHFVGKFVPEFTHQAARRVRFGISPNVG